MKTELEYTIKEENGEEVLVVSRVFLDGKGEEYGRNSKIIPIDQARGIAEFMNKRNELNV